MNYQTHLGIRLSIYTLLGNLLLTVLKFLAGIFGHSMAMISDSIHSLSDGFSTLVVILGLTFSNKDADTGHPFGHEKIESLSALFLSLFLFATGIFLGIQGMKSFFHPTFSSAPSLLALIAAIVSIGIKEFMYWCTRRVAIRIHSNALMADAWHHRSDALTSVGSFLGILGSMCGLSFCDGLASVILSLVILWVSFSIGKESIEQLIDTACDASFERKIAFAILEVRDVHSLDSFKTRQFGNRAYVEIEIGVSKDFSLEKAHAVAHQVHDKVEKEFPMIKHCMVHVNPVSI